MKQLGVGEGVDGSTIFQRTESGRETIKTKSHKLTQSERMLLIIINGVTPLDVLRKEVWSLSPERFDRALKTLVKKDLISEVLLPLHGQEAEELDTAEVDRFLQQDPLDPVTIISFDPEDEFGMDLRPATLPGSAPQESIADGDVQANAAPALAEASVAEEPQPESEPDDLALKSLAIQLARDKERQEEPFPIPPGPVSQQFFVPPEPLPNLSDDWPEDLDKVEIQPAKGQWLYWTAFICGIGLIAIWLIYRIAF